MLSPISLLVIINSVVLLLGGMVTVLAYRAYRRTLVSGLGALALGIGLITVGTAVGGVLYLVFEMRLIAGIIVQNLGVSLGFSVIIYSLVVSTRTDRSVGPM